ncbi:peptide-methionine (R)-S-oxide reductase [Meridianimarinicoccus roseus]|uniref:peptide-methionine (R)-S-oxide reductase n=1 Tax=Meridianimarinicoccus roseus TaxID=2072018 RepID=A0A2V2LEQ9_9RHOB|nr:peptide-methionine (R)-S-oxide reductase [Meridianimarinicoccus roseus]PWR00919.1 peptide-methionine (R)-S-oxide reductase [Meridianimarinicoccus roseus]
MAHHPITHGRAGLNRRTILATGLLGTMAGFTHRPAAASETPPFRYEVTRSDTEWKARLTPAEYRILREGGTELPASSPLWQEDRDGTYCCRGCDLLIYSAAWKVSVPKGWAFFRHSERDAVLTGIDGPVPSYGMSPDDDTTMIEAHCRRCGSHLGHVLLVEGSVLHCINGTSLRFTPA